MKSLPQPTTQEVLAGPVERVTFHNDDSGFCVLRIKARGHRELVTVIGHAAVISAGEWITASGEWINDRIHGQQFKAKFLKTSEPTSLDGIEKYLGSGTIRGIGPIYAKKLVHAFGEKVFDTIAAEPERLREVTANEPACRVWLGRNLAAIGQGSLALLRCKKSRHPAGLFSCSHTRDSCSALKICCKRSCHRSRYPFINQTLPSPGSLPSPRPLRHKTDMPSRLTTSADEG